MDVSTLVSQMHETLSTIHSTLASLDTKSHDARLNELERQRDTAVSSLRGAFEEEAGLLEQKRKSELHEIAEARRREDEERERRRKLEDEQIYERNRQEDEERQLRLEMETHNVEEEIDGLMNEVEGIATRLVEDGRERLRVLEERRKEINRLIDEQLKVPLPSVPSRRRTLRSSSTTLPPVVTAESKISAPNTADERRGNTLVKVPDEDKPATHARQQQVAGGDSSSIQTVEDGLITGDEEAQHTQKPQTGETTPRADTEDGTPDTEIASAPQQILDDPDIKGTDQSGTYTPRPVSIFGSLGKTIKNFVAGPSGDDSEPDSPDGDAEPSQPSLDELPLSSPAIVQSHHATGDNDVSGLHNANLNAGEDDKKNSFADGDSASGLGTDHAMSPQATLPTNPGSGTTHGIDDASSAPAGNDPSLPGSEVTDDHFAMTGHEAIPGTMTHGSDQSGSEIIAPIPGTMTHGVDHVSASEGILENLTPISELDTSGSVSVAAGPDKQPHITNSEDAADHVAEALQGGTNDPGDWEARSEARTSSLAASDGGRGRLVDWNEEAESDTTSTDNAEVDHRSEDSALVEDDSRDGSSSQNEDIEQESSANTSIASAIPISFQPYTKDDSILDHTAGTVDATVDDETDDVPAAEEHIGVPSVTVEMPYEALVPNSGEDEMHEDQDTTTDNVSPTRTSVLTESKEHLQDHNDVDLQDTEPNNSNAPSSAECHLQPFRDDGAPAHHHQREEQTNDPVLVSNSSVDVPSTDVEAQLGWDTNASRLTSGQNDPELEPIASPLTSADFHTPMQFQDWTVSQQYDGSRWEDGDGAYEIEPQLAVTVDGQDDLFDDEGQSDSVDPESPNSHDFGSNEDDKQEANVRYPKHETPVGVDDKFDPPALIGDGENIGQVTNDATENDRIDHHDGRPHVTEEVSDAADENSDLATSSPDVMPNARKGLAYSRHNPDRPRTHERSRDGFRDDELDSSDFTPAGVTNVPWRPRGSSSVRSMHSQSTISSSPTSPIHSSLAIDNHEPVIRDSWLTPTHDHLLLGGIGRSRNDSQHSSSGDFDPFSVDDKAARAQSWQQDSPRRIGAGSTSEGTTSHRNSIVSSSPAGLFQKMRSIFEPSAGQSPGDNPPSSGRNSPVWIRAANAAPHTGSRKASGVSKSPTRHGSGIVKRDGDGYDSASERRGGGFLADDAADDETDERSSLLNSDSGEGVTQN